MQTEYRYIIYKKAKRCYVVQITVVVDGKRRKVSRSAKTLDDALDVREDLMDLYRLDKSVLENMMQVKRKDPINPILENAICHWYETYKQPMLGVKSREGWEAAVYGRIIPTFGKYQWNAINKDAVQSWAFALQQKGNLFTGGVLNSETVKSIIKKLACFFSWLIENGYIDLNPCKGIKYIADTHKRKRAMTDDEIKRVLEWIKQNKRPEIYILYRLYFESGARRGELLGLRWQDIDFTEERIHIKETAQIDKHGKTFYKKMPKNAQSIRWIPISKTMVQLLKAMMKQQESTEYGYTDNIRVFHYSGKDYMNPFQVSRNFQNYCSQVGIEGVSLHCTRHTFATNMIQAGVAISTVQKVGGWKKPDVLLEHYSHVSEDAMREAMEKTLFKP